MTDDQQRARELKPCPFCGNAMAEEEDGAYQNDGFVGPQTPVWLVTCPNSDCNASVSRTSKESAIAAWNRRAALRAAPKWQPIETAPEGRLVVVGWLDTEDSHYPENYEFDYLEGGLWAKHEDCVEHAHAVAPPGSQMPKEQPPYQWWLDLPAFPSARPQGGEVMPLDPKDVTIECYPLKESGGLTFGTSAGVKITHRNGMVAICDSERSQHRNREKALATLEAMVANSPQEASDA